MKRLGFILTMITFGLFSCRNEEKKNSNTDKDLIFSELYNDSQIKSEFFEINSKRDTTLLSKNGTVVKIYSNSFIIKDDSTHILGTIKIEIKEAYKPIDFVLGNLTTTSNNQNLTSGGMIYINAQSNGQELSLRKDSEIGFFVPTKVIDENMMIYNGKRDRTNKINWKSPEPILNSKLRELEQTYITITYQYFGKFNDNDEEFNDWLWKPNRKIGDQIKVDTVQIKVIDIAKDFVSLRESENGLFIPDVITNKGKNGFLEDYNTSYIFSVNKLGWANIDRLFNDSKSEEVEMLITIDNQNEFSYVFTTLLLPNQNMYIPGYQKKDNTFGFSQNDSEKLILPINSKAFILATAYKDDKPYFKLEAITIKQNMNIFFKLNETTPEEIKKILAKNI